MSLARIRKNDLVMVMRGSSREKTGKVLQVLKGKNRAIVEGLNVVKKNLRKSQDHPKGGISEREASLELSNLMLFCEECKTGVKVGVVNQDGRKVRKCKGCGHLFKS